MLLPRTPSSALRRIAAARLGVRDLTGPQVYSASHRPTAVRTPGRSQDNSESGDEIAGTLISFVIWIIFVGTAIVIASIRKKNAYE